MPNDHIAPEDMPPPNKERKFYAGNHVADGMDKDRLEEVEKATEKVRKLIVRTIEARQRGERLSQVDPKAGDPWNVAHRYFCNPNMKLIKDYVRLIEDILDYFEFLDANPLMETKLVTYQGDTQLIEVPKMRAGTMKGMFLHIGVSQGLWSLIKTGKGHAHLKPIIDFAEAMMYDRKYNGASADLLNATLIMRDLGISEKTELSGPNGGPIEMVDNKMSPEEAMRAYASTLNPE